MTTPRQARTAAALLSTTGTAAASVIAARLLAFSNPATALSAWHQSEAQRMGQEKLKAGGEGLLAAGGELALLPWRMLQLAARPTAWTPAGCVEAWTQAAGLWLGVGNAALRPATATAVRNRARLARRHG